MKHTFSQPNPSLNPAPATILQAFRLGFSASSTGAAGRFRR
jgi:hypothetical protein